MIVLNAVRFQGEAAYLQSNECINYYGNVKCTLNHSTIYAVPP